LEKLDMITRALLRSLRNDLPMPFAFRQLGDQAPYAKAVEGRFRFRCPHCGETQAVVNPKNNLAHCFQCDKNINNIDLLLLCGYDFKSAVALLQKWLVLYRSEKAAPRFNHVSKPNHTPVPIGVVLRHNCGNFGLTK
jgi:hypothetical protein